jgi:hypothetical protein
MPLYTYILSYKGQSHVSQGSHSNFRGFVSAWCTDVPANAIPALTPVLRKELSGKAFHGDFLPLASLHNVWQKAIEIGGSECILVAIQTER